MQLLSHVSTILLFGALVGCAAVESRDASTTKDFGVLVMAHGGSDQWDRSVLDAVEPLRADYPIEVAFGMADAASLQAAVAKLESRGVQKIGVVRLFVSRDSFYERTEQVLGLRDGAPPRPADSAHEADHQGHSMAFWRVDTNAAFAVSQEGLNDADEIGDVLLDRAKSVSRNPAREEVLVLAHGAGDDAENQRWLEQMDRQADRIRAGMPFREVRVAALREDWPEKRAQAEREVRELVRAAAERGGTAIVLPYRVQGFGPYARALDGLEYVADTNGFLPHENVTRWIARQAAALHAGEFRSPRLEAAAARQRLRAGPAHQLK